jgi:copper chaperone
MEHQTYVVRGMTCDHCVNAVTDELRSLAGVTAVEVDLRVGDGSPVTVVSDSPLDLADVSAAVDEAGYELDA